MKSMTVRPSLAALLLALIGLGAGLPALAQEAAAPSAEPPGTSPPEIPSERASARATLYSFLAAFDPAQQVDGKADLAAAAACLDLSQVPRSLRAREGERLAIALKDVVDRTRYVVMEEVPDRPDGQPYVFLEREEGRIVIGAVESGEWLFTAETVAAVPALWQATRGQELAAGVNEAPRTLPLWLRSKVSAPWQTVHFLLETWQWLGMLLLGFAGWLLGRLAGSLLRRLVGRFLIPRLDGLDEDLLGRLRRPVTMLVMTLVWWLGLWLLDLPLTVLRVLHKGLALATIGALMWMGFRLVDVLTRVLTAKASETEGRFDDLLVPLIRKGLKIAVTIFGVVFLAENLDLEIGSLLAGLGLGGLAFALAAQDTVKNLFGSITVLLDRPFQIGDAVVIGGVEGSIEELGIRSTRIRTFDGSLVTLPNSNLISASVDNLGARPTRRWKTVLSLTYDTPPAKIEAFCEGVRELIRRHPRTSNNFHVYLNSFAASSLDVLMVLYVVTQTYATDLQTRHELALQILRLAEALGVELAFPTQTIHMAPAEGKVSAAPGEGDDLEERAREIARSLAPGRDL